MGDFDFQNILNKLSELLSAWGMKVVGALALLIIGLIVLKLIRRSVIKGLKKTRLDVTLVPYISGVVYYILLAVLILAVLSLFGVETTSVIAILGAAGLAVGLALQGTLSNFAAGVMLLIFRPFRIGDFVETGGVSGVIAEIGTFSTKLNTPDNVLITVPNSAVYGQTIKNYTAHDKRRIDLVVGISYPDDIGKAIETINRVISADERILKDPAPQVAVSEMADSSVNLVVRPWCNTADYWTVRFDLIRRLKEEIEAAGLSIPFPQRDVHLYNADKSAA